MIDECVVKVRASRAADRPVMLAFGDHAIQNGGRGLIRLMDAAGLPFGDERGQHHP